MGPQNRAQQFEDKEKEEALSFLMDPVSVLAKRPEARIKWLQKGLIFAAKKHVQISVLFTIATHKKFMSGLSESMEKQLQTMLQANLHLFSLKQQRFLQSDRRRPSKVQAEQSASEASDSESCAKTRK